MELLRCKYASKPCPNERSLKDDGTRHRLCVGHREKAREAQRRWHARRRSGVGYRPKTMRAEDNEPEAPALKRLCVVDTHDPVLLPYTQDPVCSESETIEAHGATSPLSVAFAWAFEPNGIALPIVEHGEQGEQWVGRQELAQELTDWWVTDALELLFPDEDLNARV